MLPAIESVSAQAEQYRQRESEKPGGHSVAGGELERDLGGKRHAAVRVARTASVEEAPQGGTGEGEQRAEFERVKSSVRRWHW